MSARWGLRPGERRWVPGFNVGLGLSGGERLLRPLSFAVRPKVYVTPELKFKVGAERGGLVVCQCLLLAAAGTGILRSAQTCALAF